MKVVLDSSVLVAAFISRAGVCATVMEDVLAHHELALSSYILNELTRKLTEKFDFRAADVREVRRFLEGSVEIVEAVPLPPDRAIAPPCWRERERSGLRDWRASSHGGRER